MIQCRNCHADVVIVGGNPRCTKCCQIVNCDFDDERELRAAGMVLQRLSGKKVGKAIADGFALQRKLVDGEQKT